jgi:hypothetical protein
MLNIPGAPEVHVPEKNIGDANNSNFRLVHYATSRFKSQITSSRKIELVGAAAAAAVRGRTNQLCARTKPVGKNALGLPYDGVRRPVLLRGVFDDSRQLNCSRLLPFSLVFFHFAHSPEVMLMGGG